ncbi:Uncharacterized protein dnl_09740 [Desulfonema limicola]|uniref:Uncharacterized protein n=2 Tax=Desulfonema limicola TaxID=45656 RepID=A0A975B4Q8_9BACT|nr:Uncharacterized protein dnl_09740 [Desulfonema limicola]
MTMNYPRDFKVSQCSLIAGFLRGGLTMNHACDIVNVTPWQGRYMLVKNGCRPADIKASPDYAKYTFSKGALNAAIELLFMGGTPEDIFFVTGITMNRLLLTFR